MRKILTLPQVRVAAVATLAHFARCAALGALSVGLSSSDVLFAQTLQPFTGSFSDSGSTSVAFAEVPQGALSVPSSGLVSKSSSLKASTESLISNGVASPVDRGHVAPVQYSPPQPFGSGMFGSSGSMVGADQCFVGCDINWYVGYEALWLRREGDERFSLSRNTIMKDFGYDFGGRYTVGRMFDCVNGWEGVYVGPYSWERQATVTGNGNLQSNFSPSNGFTLADIATFNNADIHTQVWNAELHSFELNRRWWSWDVLSTLIGIRYVDYEENFAFRSTSGALNGLYTERLDNNMIGAQVGADIMYPVSLRTTVGFRGKAGVYANFAERSTFLSDGGTLLLNTGDNSVSVAGLIEGGVFAHYQIVRSIRLTAGYEFWYMPGAATVAEQSPGLLTPSSGTSVRQKDDLFLHGGSLGVQILF
jgi:hypothetical protein